MAQTKVIEPAQFAWDLPLAFTPKGDVSLRFCVDFCRLIPVRSRMLTQSLGWTNALIDFGKVISFYHLILIQSVSISKTSRLIASELRLHRIMDYTDFFVCGSVSGTHQDVPA